MGFPISCVRLVLLWTALSLTPRRRYYGVVTNNQTLVQLAYDNCRLYRAALLNTTAPDGPCLGTHL